MKHNKKRNTAFLYECLIKELTKAIIREDRQRQLTTKKIIKEFFHKSSFLYKEQILYSSLLKREKLDENFSRRLLEETRKDFYKLDRKSIFNTQTKLINVMNQQLGHNVFSNFIPNYKDIASVGLFFQNQKLEAKKRIMLEEKLVRLLTSPINSSTDLKHLDNLEYQTFVNKFNQAYDRTLRVEQKNLLTNYIVSFSDNGVGLKSFLNEEIGRLKDAVTLQLTEGPTSANNENFKKVQAKLEGYSKIPINQQMVEEIFYIQDLLAEVSKNGT